MSRERQPAFAFSNAPAERELLGHLLCAGGAGLAALGLEADDFSTGTHRAIFLAIGRCVAADGHVSVTTLHRELARVGPGVPWSELFQLHEEGLDAGPPARLVAILKECRKRARLDTLGAMLRTLARNMTVADLDAEAGELARQLLELATEEPRADAGAGGGARDATR